jgi:hypothetical protein
VMRGLPARLRMVRSARYAVTFSNTCENGLYCLGLPLRRRLVRSSTVVCATLSNRAMARMLSPFSAKARTRASNFSPNDLALTPKCSTASVSEMGQVHAAALKGPT